MKKLVLLLIVLCYFSSCRTKYVSVPEYHKVYITKADSFIDTDTVREKEWMTIKEVDSTELADLGIQLRNIKSAYLIEKNRNKEHYSSVSKSKTDTIIITDSISVPYPVERKLNKWERFKVDYGGYSMGINGVILLIVIVIGVIRNRKIKI